MAGGGLLTELRDLIQFKKSGELSAEEFTSAKAVLFGEMEQAAEQGDFEQAANATNRPMAEGKRYRRRSVKDWIQRMQQDLKAQETTATDKRKQAMLALTQTINNAYAPDGNSANITPETINAALAQYWEEDGYLDYADFPGASAGKNILAGRYTVASGQLGTIFNMWTQVGEYHFDFAKATMAAFNNTLIMDLGWYKVVSKNAKDEEGNARTYENNNKAVYVFNDTCTKVKSISAYWEDEVPAEGQGGILDMYKFEDFAGQITKFGIKADGPPMSVATYPSS